MAKLTKRLVDAFSTDATEDFLWDGEVKGFGVRARSSGAKSFLVAYRIGGRAKRLTICKVGSPYTVDQAREVAVRMLRLAKEGRDPALAKAEERKAVTVAELVDAYLDEGPALRANKKASSWATDRSVFSSHVKPLLGRRLAKDIDASDVARMQADIAAGKTARAEKGEALRGRRRVTGGKRVAALAVSILSAAYQFGIETSRLADNPARGVARLKTPGRERFLSEVEVAAVAEALSVMVEGVEINAGMADAIRLLLLTGCRRNEVLAAEWAWVDFEHRCLRLPDSKTGAKVVPLAAPALQILESRRESTAPLSRRIKRHEAIGGGPLPSPRSRFVFPASRGDGHIVGLRRSWEAVKVKAAGIMAERLREVGRDPALARDLSDVRLHDLRHSFASFAVEGGAPLLVLGKVLGHRQASTTEVYAHLSDDPVRGVAERTGARIAEAMKPRKKSGDVVRLPTKAG